MKAIRFAPFVSLVALLIAAGAPVGCGETLPSSQSGLDAARSAGRGGEPDAIGRWLLAELTEAGGDAKAAADARKRLDESKGERGLDAALAAALDDDLHGRSGRAFAGWLAVIDATAKSRQPRAQLVGAFAADAFLRAAAWVSREEREAAAKKLLPIIEATSPSLDGGLGWRGRQPLAAWSNAVLHAHDEPAAREEAQRKANGCVTAMRIAGPFELAPGEDERAALEGEVGGKAGGSWPSVFEGRPNAPTRPRIVKSRVEGCTVFGEADEAGYYLAETYLDVDRTRELVFLTGASARLTIDEQVMQSPEPTRWASALDFGVVAKLAPGRHRIRLRLGQRVARLDVRERDGRPYAPVASTDPTLPFGAGEVVRIDDPHPALSASRARERDAVTTWLAAAEALSDGAPDVAAVVLGAPLNEDAAAAIAAKWPAPVLELAGRVSLEDPIWSQDLAASRARTLFDKAFELDPLIAHAPLASMELRGESLPPIEKVKKLEALSPLHPDTPAAQLALLEAYEELGWSAEARKTVEAIGKAFPDDLDVLRTRLRFFDAQGPVAEADAIAERLAREQPDTPVLAERLLARGDIKGGVAAYEAFTKAHPSDKSHREKLEELRGRLDDVDAATARLVKQIAKGDAPPLLEGDLALVKGERHAMQRAVDHAIDKHAWRPADALKAIDVLSQTVDFAPFRRDAKKIVAEHDKRRGDKAPVGSAERILDYGVTWFRSDGTGSFLEQEIVRVNGREAIEELAHVRPSSGRVLHQRVLKKDGRVLEPEKVSGKPDLTYPDLEVGDVLESETITKIDAPARAFIGSRWFFAEPHIAYARSEYVVITPKGRSLLIERVGGAPEPKLSTLGAFEVRSFVVDDAPPAPDEPEHRAPAQEIVPNVLFGWGVSLDEMVANAAVAAKDTTPVDPRIEKLARTLVGGIPESKRAERVRALYHWVAKNVARGPEQDGRRAIVGRAGDPGAAFRVLVRAVGIPVDSVAARDRLAPKPLTELSAAEGFRHGLLRMPTDEGDLYVAIGNRYTPFGYLPPGARGEEGIVLRAGTPHVKIPESGPSDGMRVSGTLDLDASGDARGTLTLSYLGLAGASIREELEKLSPAELQVAIESQLLAPDLPGVRLRKLEVVDRDDADKPLGFRVDVDVPSFARSVRGGLVLIPPFQARMSALASAPTRATPELIAQSNVREVAIDVNLPASAKLLRGPITGSERWGRQHVEASDKLEGQRLSIRRRAEIAVDRVEPAAYPKLFAFARSADALALQETVISP